MPDDLANQGANMHLIGRKSFFDILKRQTSREKYPVNHKQRNLSTLNLSKSGAPQAYALIIAL